MTNDVRPSRSAFIACCTSTSVRVSTELVASSSTRIAGSARNARAMVRSCFSPALTLDPSSSITVAYPSGSVRTNGSTCVARVAARNASSSTVRPSRTP